MPDAASILSSITTGINALNQLRKPGGALLNFNHTGDKSLVKVHNEIHAQNINILVGKQDLPAPGRTDLTPSVPTAGALARPAAGSLAAEAQAGLVQAVPTRGALPPGTQDERHVSPPQTPAQTEQDPSIQLPFSMGLTLVIDNKEWLRRDEPFALDSKNLLVPVGAPDAIIEFNELNSNARKIAILVRANQPVALCLGWSDSTDRPSAKVSQDRAGAYEWPLVGGEEIKAGRSAWQVAQVPLGSPIDVSATTPTALIFRAEVAGMVWMLRRTHPERGIQSYWLIVPRAE